MTDTPCCYVYDMIRYESTLTASRGLLRRLSKFQITTQTRHRALWFPTIRTSTWWSASSTMLMDTLGNDSLESDGMDMRKEKMLGNKRGNFIGSLLDDIGVPRRTMAARLLVIATTLPHGFVHTLVSIMQRSGEPGDALLTFFV
jgi:hypothetical protein